MQNPAAYSGVGADVIEKIQSLNMNFLGLNLEMCIRDRYCMATSATLSPLSHFI